jgi:hypothetical protein
MQIMGPGGSVLGANQHPSTKLVASGTATLNRDKFFSTVVLIANGKEFTIRELIKFEAKQS